MGDFITWLILIALTVTAGAYILLVVLASWTAIKNLLGR